jgi:hypothetical protein
MGDALVTSLSRASLVVLAFVAAAACTPGDPLADLTSEDKAYLFADTETDVPFLGQPVDNGPLNCYPQRMNQAYAFVDTADELWLKSIRPTGVEKHRILSVVASDNGYVVTAKNGVGVNFELLIQKKDRDLATISWDGAPAEVYRRCPVMGG